MATSYEMCGREASSSLFLCLLRRLHSRLQSTTKLDFNDEDGIKASELEGEFAEMDGYTAEARAGELLLGLGIPIEQHFGPMSEVAPGWKLRVLLAQVLFADPDIMLLDEPTSALDSVT